MSIQSNIYLLEDDHNEKKNVKHTARKAAEKAAEANAENAAELAEAARKADWEEDVADRRRATAIHVSTGNLDDPKAYIQELVNTMNKDNSSRAAATGAGATAEADDAAKPATFLKKIGGMATRKKKYRRRNKTKRYKRQKKRYTKKYRMRY